MKGLDAWRAQLDEIDDSVTALLGKRLSICREIALYKREHDIPMMQPARVEEVRERYLTRGAEAHLPADFTEKLFDLLIATTCAVEDELINAGTGQEVQ